MRAVDAPVARDDPVRRRLSILEAAHRVVDAGVQPQLREGPGVDQLLDPLERGELPGGVLARDALDATAQARAGTALVEVLDERAQPPLTTDRRPG